MNVKLNETTAEKINSLVTENVSAETVIDLAVDTLLWTKGALDEGKTVMAGKRDVVDDLVTWLEEEFYPATELLNELYRPSTDEAPDAE